MVSIFGLSNTCYTLVILHHLVLDFAYPLSCQPYIQLVSSVISALYSVILWLQRIIIKFLRFRLRFRFYLRFRFRFRLRLRLRPSPPPRLLWHLQLQQWLAQPAIHEPWKLCTLPTIACLFSLWGWISGKKFYPINC